MLEAFPPSALIDWANTLGAHTFTGSSGRIFPKAMKASPLLRAWLERLNRQNVQFRLRHDWRGWSDGALHFDTPAGDVTATHDVTVLALGGASWPRLGADGGWTTLLQEKGVEIAPLRPANMGFNVGWSEHFRTRFAGQPLKNVMLRFGGHTARGDAMITRYGIEGGARLRIVVRRCAKPSPAHEPDHPRHRPAPRSFAATDRQPPRPPARQGVARQLLAQIHRPFADGNQSPARDRHAARASQIRRARDSPAISPSPAPSPPPAAFPSMLSTTR